MKNQQSKLLKLKIIVKRNSSLDRIKCNALLKKVYFYDFKICFFIFVMYL